MQSKIAPMTQTLGKLCPLIELGRFKRMLTLSSADTPAYTKGVSPQISLGVAISSGHCVQGQRNPGNGLQCTVQQYDREVSIQGILFLYTSRVLKRYSSVEKWPSQDENQLGVGTGSLGIPSSTDSYSVYIMCTDSYVLLTGPIHHLGIHQCGHRHHLLPMEVASERGDCDEPFGSVRFVTATDIEGVMGNGVGCCFAMYVCMQ